MDLELEICTWEHFEYSVVVVFAASFEIYYLNDSELNFESLCHSNFENFGSSFVVNCSEISEIFESFDSLEEN